MMTTRIAVLAAALLTAHPAATGWAQTKPGDRAVFTVGTAKAARGQTATGAIEVPAGSDAAMSIPVAVAHGAKAGPVLALLAGAHGTEYASIIALEKLITGIDAKQLSGTVIIVPLLNVPSFVKIVHAPQSHRRQEHEPDVSRPSGWHADRPRVSSDHDPGRGAVRSRDRLSRRRHRREPAAVLVLEPDRPRRPGRDLESDGARVRSRSHRDLAESPEGSGGVGVLREHRDDAEASRRSSSKRVMRGRSRTPMWRRS